MDTYAYLNRNATRAMTCHYIALTAVLVRHVNTGAGACGRGARFLDAALDVVCVVGAVGCEVEAGGYAVPGCLAGT